MSHVTGDVDVEDVDDNNILITLAPTTPLWLVPTHNYYSLNIHRNVHWLQVTHKNVFIDYKLAPEMFS